MLQDREEKVYITDPTTKNFKIPVGISVLPSFGLPKPWTHTLAHPHHPGFSSLTSGSCFFYLILVFCITVQQLALFFFLRVVFGSQLNCREGTEICYIPSVPNTCTAFLIINISNLIGTVATIYQLILIHHNHPKSIV